MYSIDFTESARKEFLRMPTQEQERIDSVLDRIRLKPYFFAMRLSGSKAYRIRVGKLRIILDILEENQQIIVLKLGNRETVYLP
ncbi:MAG: type II toxin-antitoxin system RelE/ParE family toxin [Candidatus Micrarchaeota archaeon]